MRVIRRSGVLHRFLSPFLRFAARLSGHQSPWQRFTLRVPPGVFGPGSRRPFAEYLEGHSGVPARSIDDIVAWLQACEYVTDLEQFHERDVWQHPAAFEQVRRGDCEDFALWAWRKLAEIGVDADLVVGRVIGDDSASSGRQHAWVIYRAEGCEFLFEPAARSAADMVRPLDEAMDQYVPHFAVNHRLRTDAFVGCVAASSQDAEDPRVETTNTSIRSRSGYRTLTSSSTRRAVRPHFNK